MVVVVVLVDRVQRVARQQIALEPRAVTLHRGVMSVVGERCRDVTDLVAAQPQPPAEVDVLEEHEVALVESTDRAVEIGAHDHGRSGGEQDIGLFLEGTGVGLAGVVLVRLTVEAHPDRRVVEVRAVPVEHLARHAPDRRLRLEDVNSRADPVPMGPRVRVQQARCSRRWRERRRDCSPPAKPTFVADSTSAMSGAPARRMSTLPSPDALSTTMISSCSMGQSRPRRPSTAVSVCSADLKLTMTTETRGCTAGRA